MNSLVRERTLGTWVLLAAGLVLFSAATVTRADADLWGHLRFGLDTIQARHLTSIDPYSFTQDTPWINHEWLSEVQMAAAWSLAGPAGLVLLKATIVFVVFALVWLSIQHLSPGRQAAIVLLVVIGTIQMWAFVRPQLWTLVCFAILCRVLPSDKSWPRLCLPAMFAVWANCHGGWIVGLGVLGAWTIGSVFFRRAEAWEWLAVLAGCAAATLVNPYGWLLWAFMLRTVHLTRSIAEWEPLWVAPGLNWLPWAASVAAGVLLTVRQTDSRRWRTALVLAMLAYASLRVQRIESLLIVYAAIALPPWFRAGPAERVRDLPAAFGGILGIGLVTAAAVLAAVMTTASLRCIRVFGDWVPDTEAARVLEMAPPGRLVTFFDWGEYAIWHFGPRLKVSMDGRRETIYSEARLTEQDAIVAGTETGLATLAAWRAEYVWLPARSAATKRWLVSHGYRIDADTPRSFVAVRQDLPVLTASKPAVPACFPG